MQKWSLCVKQLLRGISVFVTFLESQSHGNLGTYVHDFSTFLLTLDREGGGGRGGNVFELDCSQDTNIVFFFSKYSESVN